MSRRAQRTRVSLCSAKCLGFLPGVGGPAAFGSNACNRGEPRIVANALQLQRKLASPVRMLIGRARHIGLVAQRENVLEADRQETRRRSREKARNGRKVASRTSLALERCLQGGDRTRALLAGLAGRDAQRVAHRQVMLREPPREGRQVVRREGDEGALG